MSRQGKGRNQIAHELSLVNIHCSTGSVSNVLKESRERQNKEQVINATPETNISTKPTTPPEATISTTIDNNIFGPPSSNPGDALVYRLKSEVSAVKSGKVINAPSVNSTTVFITAYKE